MNFGVTVQKGFPRVTLAPYNRMMSKSNNRIRQVLCDEPLARTDRDDSSQLSRQAVHSRDAHYGIGHAG